MADRIAFLSRLPPLAIFSKLFGIDYLSKNNFEIIFVDLSFLIDGQISKSLYKDQSPPVGCEILIINSWDQLDTFVKESAANTIFIDMVVGASTYGFKEARIFRILKKYNAKYYVVCGGLVPTIESFSKSSSYLNKIKRAFTKPSLLMTLIIRGAILFLIRLNIIYPKPHRILGLVRNPQLQSYCKKIRYKKPITLMNSYNYGDYIDYINLKASPPEIKNICVFLDEDHTNHPDFYLLGMAPLNQDEYLLSMNRFFDYIEKKTGLSVVVAAHPKSRFTENDHPYGERAFIKNKTIHLVAKSKMVIAHSSTSISYPVLFHKPLLLVFNNVMKSRIGMVDTVRAFAKDLDLIPIDVDNAIEANEFRLDLDSRQKYEDYLYKYVFSAETIKEKPWATVAFYCKEDTEN